MHCERGVLRICEDLYELQSYSRVLVVSMGKAGHTMAEALAHQVGESFLGASVDGIVATSVDVPAQVRGFRYFRGGHPTPNAESIQAASAILKALDAQTAASLVIFMISGGGSSIVEKAHRRRNFIGRSDRDLSRSRAFGRAHRRNQCHPQTSFSGERRKAGAGGVSRRSRFRCWSPMFQTAPRMLSRQGRQCLTRPAWRIAIASPRNTA